MRGQGIRALPSQASRAGGSDPPAAAPPSGSRHACRCAARSSRGCAAVRRPMKRREPTLRSARASFIGLAGFAIASRSDAIQRPRMRRRLSDRRRLVFGSRGRVADAQTRRCEGRSTRIIQDRTRRRGCPARRSEARARRSCLALASESGWRDLNPRPLDPQSSALSKLRHSPSNWTRQSSRAALLTEHTDRVGFEPTIELSPYTAFPVLLLQPLGHLSRAA